MERHICEAIARRRLLMFGYGDTVRLAEPHLYGVNTAGHEAVSAWLRPGYSRSQPEGGWRMFLVDAMHRIGIMSEEFTARPGYNQQDPHFTEVYCKVEGPAGAGGEPAQGMPETASSSGVASPPGSDDESGAV